MGKTKTDRLIYKSEPSTDNLIPKWKSFYLPVHWAISIDHPIKFKVINRNKDFTFEVTFFGNERFSYL